MVFQVERNQVIANIFQMTDYLMVAIVNAVRQFLCGYGIVFQLAFSDVAVEPAAAGNGVWMGKSYSCFVASGVMFRELGHALGCVFTLTRHDNKIALAERCS